jgi:hypothetical protein
LPNPLGPLELLYRRRRSSEHVLAISPQIELSPGGFARSSAIGPILYLMEYAIELRACAPRNLLERTFTARIRQGCERFRFDGHVISPVAAPESVAREFRAEVESDCECALRLSSGDSNRNLLQDAFSDFAFLLPFDAVLPASALMRTFAGFKAEGANT